MITHILVPAYIVMFLYKSYTKVAVALHVANGFVRIHFAHQDKDVISFIIGVRKAIQFIFWTYYLGYFKTFSYLVKVQKQ